jgi:hypothetical protein
VIIEHRIGHVFPAYDDVLLALAENMDQLSAKVVTSPVETCRITRSKSRTYELLRGVLPVPRVFASAEDVSAADFPVFVKPDRGQGSVGACLVHSPGELRRAVESGSLLIMEALGGSEVTVDCFSDRDRGLLFCRGRERVRVRSGISMHSIRAHEPVFEEYALRISEKLEMHGAWFFQLRVDSNGIHRLLEVAPRIAGTMALNRALGVNFPLLSLYEQERVEVSISANDVDAVIDRALVNRYRHDLDYSTVYVDLDDTLLIRGEVDTVLVRFLFQCLNEKKQLVLLTRHRGDVQETLAMHRLGGLWDEIVQLGDGERKSDYIAGGAAILIDDSFRERSDAARRRGIATFDVSMLELLIDDRV